MRFLKKNKLAILLIVFFIIITAVLYGAYRLFQGDNGVVYGHRLDGIEAVVITLDQENKLIEELKGNENVSNVEISIIGKTVNIIITVLDNATLDIAKGIGNLTLGYFEKDQLAYYDLQVFIKKTDTAQNNFPIIGYKHNKSAAYIWTKDREVTK